MFGDGEWAIRFFAPILHGIAAFFLFLLGKRAFDARIGAWAAAIYLLMPGIFLSSTIMSTDAVLLPTVSAALYFLWRFRDSPTFGQRRARRRLHRPRHAGKYAALYLYGGAVLAALVDRDMRKAMLSLPGATVFIASLVVLGPNLAWNVANDFATVSHTADNANLPRLASTRCTSSATCRIRPQSSAPSPCFCFWPASLSSSAARTNGRPRASSGWSASSCRPCSSSWRRRSCRAPTPTGPPAPIPPPASCVASWIDRVFGRPTSRLNVGPVLKAGVAINVMVGLLFTAPGCHPTLPTPPAPPPA